MIYKINPQKPNVFVITHKKFNFPRELDDCYLPLQVGTGNDIDNYLRENIVGSDNIASKNANFCELTALYYMWKNIDAQIIGLVHYRRYFYKQRDFLTYTLLKIRKLFSVLPADLKTRYQILSKSDIANILEQYDIIVPIAGRFENETLYENYCKAHHADDWHKTEQIIIEKYPEYHSTFKSVADDRNFIAANMFIAKKHIIDQYCEWLFDILFELETQIDLTYYDDYNKRVFGFLSERLFTVWVTHHQHQFKVFHAMMRQI